MDNRKITSVAEMCASEQSAVGKAAIVTVPNVASENCRRAHEVFLRRINFMRNRRSIVTTFCAERGAYDDRSK
jgi:hypothetical protein